MKILKYFLVVVAILLAVIFVLILIGIINCTLFYSTSEQIVPKPITEEMDEETLFSVPVVKKYSDAGDISAQYVYGCYFLFGRGVEKDEVKGVALIRQAAEQGLPYAQGAMAYCYYYGKGVPQDFEEARQWIQKAEESGLNMTESKEFWEKDSAKK